MARYNLVKIGSIYLTDNGLVTGKPCKLEVPGLSRLKLTITGTTRYAADGTPYQYSMPNAGKGVQIQIRPFVIMKSVFDDVIEAMSDALEANSTINITVEGDTGDFDLDCIPLLPNGVEFPGAFTNERITGVSFNFVVSEVN